jgi:hypothetical protein
MVLGEPSIHTDQDIRQTWANTYNIRYTYIRAIHEYMDSALDDAKSGRLVRHLGILRDSEVVSMRLIGLIFLII